MKQINYLDKVFELEKQKRKGLIIFVISFFLIAATFIVSCCTINYVNRILIFVLGSLFVSALSVIFLYSLIFIFCDAKKTIKRIVPLAVKDSTKLSGIVEEIKDELTLSSGLRVIEFTVKIGSHIETCYWDLNNGGIPFEVKEHISILVISNIVTELVEVKK